MINFSLSSKVYKSFKESISSVQLSWKEKDVSTSLYQALKNGYEKFQLYVFFTSCFLIFINFIRMPKIDFKEMSQYVTSGVVVHVIFLSFFSMIFYALISYVAKFLHSFFKFKIPEMLLVILSYVSSFCLLMRDGNFEKLIK